MCNCAPGLPCAIFPNLPSPCVANRSLACNVKKTSRCFRVLESKFLPLLCCFPRKGHHGEFSLGHYFSCPDTVVERNLSCQQGFQRAYPNNVTCPQSFKLRCERSFVNYTLVVTFGILCFIMHADFTLGV